jgi:hypothetical protein
MSLFNRYIAHPTASTTGRTGLPATSNPLGAGRMTLWASNTQHLCEQNPVRVIRSHAGVRNFYAPAVDAGFNATPTVRNIRWSTSPKDGAAVIDLGVFYAWRRPDGRLPVVRLSFTTQVEGAYTLGWVFALSQGEAGPLFAVQETGGTTTSATWDAVTATLDLNALPTLGPVDVAPTNGLLEVDDAERGTLQCFRAFFGAYNNSNSNTAGHYANVVGLSLRLEAP